jgi:hypothetical protein
MHDVTPERQPYSAACMQPLYEQQQLSPQPFNSQEWLELQLPAAGQDAAAQQNTSSVRQEDVLRIVFHHDMLL